MKKKAKKKAKKSFAQNTVSISGTIIYKDIEKIKNLVGEQISMAFCRETPYYSIFPRVVYLGQIDWISWGEMKILPPPRNYAREADEAIGKILHALGDLFYQERRSWGED